MRWLILVLALLWPLGAFAQSAEEARDRSFLSDTIEGLISTEDQIVRIDGFHGALSSQATVARLSIADRDGEWLIARDLTLDWTRSALVRGRLEIDQLTAGSIEVLRSPEGDSPPPKPEAVPFALPDLPVAVNIGTLTAERITLGAALLGQEVVLRLDGQAALAAGAGEAEFTAARIDGNVGLITLEGGFSNATRVLALDLAMSEGEGGIAATLLGIPGTPALDLTISGTGPLDDYDADLRLASNGVERLAGHFALKGQADGEGQVYTVDLQGDLTPILSPDYHEFFGTDAALHIVALQGADGSLDLPELEITAQALRLSGQMRLAPGGWPEAFSLSGDLGLDDGTKVRLPGGDAPLLIEAATLTIGFDAALGKDWSGSLTTIGLEGEGYALDELTLDGGGTITLPDDDEAEDEARGFSLDMAYRAGGITIEDPGLAKALGTTATGRLSLARTGDAPVNLRALSISGPGIEAELSGILGGERLAYDLQLALQAADLGRFAQLSGLALAGSADLDVNIDGRLLDRTVALHATGGMRDLALGIDAVDPLLAGEGVLSLAVVRDGEGLRVERLIARTGALAATGSADLTSDKMDGRFTLQLDDAGRFVPGIAGPADIVLTLQQDDTGLRAVADASAPGIQADVTATRAEGDEDFALRVTGTIPELAAFADLAGIDLAGRADLSLRGTAGTEDIDLALAARVADLSTGIAALDPLIGDRAVIGARLERGADQVLAVNGLTFNAAQVSAAGSARMAPDGILSLDLGASALGADAWIEGALAKGTFTGAVDLSAQDLSEITSGAVTGGASLHAGGQVALDLSMLDLTVSGTTRDLDAGVAALAPMTAGAGTFSGAVRRTDGGPFHIEGARLQTPAATLLANGQTDAGAVSADLTLDLPQLRSALPGLSGPGHATAAITRDAAGLVGIDLQAEGAGAVVALVANADGPEPMQGLRGDLTVTAADLAPLGRIAGIALSGAGEANITGHVVPEDLSAELTLAATLRNLNPGNPNLATVLTGEGQVQAQLSRDADGRMVLRDAQAAFPNFTASGSAEGSTENLVASYNARLADVGLLAADFSGPATAEGSARMSALGWSLDGALTGPGGMNGQISGQISSAGDPDLRANGTLPLGLLNAFIEPRRLRGEAAFDLRLAGQMALEGITGSLRVNGAEAADPELGLHLTGINGTATLTGGRATLSLRSDVNGGGSVSMTGGIELAGVMPADLTIAARAVALRDPELYETSATGDIRISGPLAGGARISGQIELGATELRIPSSDIGGLGDLPPVRHLGAPADVARTLARAGANDNGAQQAPGGRSGALALDILLTAPSRIFIRGRGLDAELGGSLRLQGTTANIIPSGAFTLIRGRLDILQQRFTLNEGRAVLLGDFIPRLHLVARTRARTGTDIAITLEGPADAPEVSFSSQPELPQDEVLSQLLFGRDIASITPLQAVQLAAAAATLAGRGGGGIVDKLRIGLGVDDLDVVTDEDGNAGLRLGRYLGENLYTDVTLGAETEVNINLDLTPDITVTGSVDTDGETRLGIHFARDY